jgi:hypothetical protein
VNRLLSRLVIARGRGPARRLLEARAAPARVAAETLQRILRCNADSVFGVEHGFSQLSSSSAYARAVPVRDYEAFAPYVERMLGGEAGVLCSEAPFMFGTTSGTTSKRKFIPINRGWAGTLSCAMRLWLARSTRAHPELWRGKVLTLVGSPREGTVTCGLPSGSVSGLTSARVPRAVRQRYVLSPLVSEIADHDTRYEVAARLMLESEVSLAATPNPTTLLRLAEVGAARGESILRGIFEGRLGVTAHNEEDALRLAELDAECRPDPARARALEQASRSAGRLLPRNAWPRLSMIGCWLGGTAGVFAQRLQEPYGDVPLRDLGLRATEATMTVALEDGVADGAPLLHDNFYEFMSESEARGGHPRTLGIHELEIGARYFILLTTAAGLYRYDISDVVEVTGKYHELPLLRFVHKGPDMLNMTGEKVHAEQVATAVMRASRRCGVAMVKAQAIPNLSSGGYDLLLEAPLGAALAELARVFDAELSNLNPEYENKRRTGRLASPLPVRMTSGWSKRLQAADVANGSRETQYKWPFVRHAWDAVSRPDVAPDESSTTPDGAVRIPSDDPPR